MRRVVYMPGARYGITTGHNYTNNKECDLSEPAVVSQQSAAQSSSLALALLSSGSSAMPWPPQTVWAAAAQAGLEPHPMVTTGLPDAPHRQAWASHPTFRWLRRREYASATAASNNSSYSISGRMSRTCSGPKFNLSARGDNYYKPLSMEEQRHVNKRILARIQRKGVPRLGEW